MAATKEHSKLRQLPGLGLRVSRSHSSLRSGAGWEKQILQGAGEVTKVQTLRGCRICVKNLGFDPKRNRKQQEVWGNWPRQ